MNTKSPYKDALESRRSRREDVPTIHPKDLRDLSPIPTSIKIASPKGIAALTVCGIFTYPIEAVLNTGPKASNDIFSRVYVCAYAITNCKNRDGIDTPYLQYLLYKYPADMKKVGNLVVFPFSFLRKGQDPLNAADKLCKSITKVKISREGFIEDSGNIFVFYNFSSHKKFKIKYVKLIKQSATLWWTLIDEICNHRKLLNFPIHDSVYRLFYRNPTLIYLLKDNKRLDIPIAGYYGNYYKILPIIVTLGQKPTVWPSAKFGPYYYFRDYRGAFRYAGWTKNYQPRKIYGVQIAGKGGRIIKGGLVRFALFMHHAKILLDEPHDPIRDYVKGNKDWTKRYNSLYLGSVPRVAGSVYSSNPQYVVKNFDQQVPLSMHLVNMSSLKGTWDPLYNGYGIE